MHQACGSGFVRPGPLSSFLLSCFASRAGLLLPSPLAISQKNSLTMEKKGNAYLRVRVRGSCVRARARDA
jgi:hypothetical protein